MKFSFTRHRDAERSPTTRHRIEIPGLQREGLRTAQDRQDEQKSDKGFQLRRKRSLYRGTTAEGLAKEGGEPLVRPWVLIAACCAAILLVVTMLARGGSGRGSQIRAEIDNLREDYVAYLVTRFIPAPELKEKYLTYLERAKTGRPVAEDDLRKVRVFRNSSKKEESALDAELQKQGGNGEFLRLKNRFDDLSISLAWAVDIGDKSKIAPIVQELMMMDGDPNSPVYKFCDRRDWGGYE